VTAPIDDLITVVIPTFNRQELLKKAVKSVTDQNVAGVLIHIFDNCSTDGTEQCVAGLIARHPNIRYTKRDSNIGALPNYIGALATVETPFYIPLADDDWLLDGSISLLLETMQRDPSLGAVVSQTVSQTEDGNCTRVNPGDQWEYRRYEPDELIPLWVKRGHFEWSSILFRTAAKDAIGGPDIHAGSVWDVDFQLQVFLRYPVTLVNYQSAVYLAHPEQQSREVSTSKYHGVLTTILKFREFANTHNKSGAIVDATGEFARDWIKKIACDIAYYGSWHDLCYVINLRKSFLLPELTMSRLLIKWMRYKWRILKARAKNQAR